MTFRSLETTVVIKRMKQCYYKVTAKKCLISNFSYAPGKLKK